LFTLHGAIRQAWAVALAVAVLLHAAAAQAGFQLAPAELKLQGNFATAQILVTATAADGRTDERSADLTMNAAYRSANPQIAAVSDAGRVTAVGNGEAEILVTVSGETRPVKVQVAGIAADPKISFAREIIPILSKAGCNAGACHASQFGKAGFKLSVFGYAPEEDYQAIVRDAQGRRVNLLEPPRSLVLLKPTRTIPHGGNRRIEPGSVDYQIVLAWLGGGAPASPRSEPAVTGIRVAPNRHVGELGFTQQLQVTATYSDGHTRDVTAWAKFDSMDDAVVHVTPAGLVHSTARGQAPVMVRFEGQAETAMMVSPYASGADAAVNLADWKDENYIDALAAQKFKELGIPPAPLCDDATFLRRAYLDAIGTLPSVAEANAFLDSTDPAKRRKLVDQLLGLTGDPKQDVHNGDYAAYWSVKYADLIRSASTTVGEQGMWTLHNWLRESLGKNVPFDQFVRELLTATGSTYMNGPANYFRISASPAELAEVTAQTFLGVRLQCAKCHHHPFEKYSQADYYGFAAFFARVGAKESDEFGVFGGEQVIALRSSGEVQHPKTDLAVPPTLLDGTHPAESFDRRQALARWMTAPENHLLARNMANRYAAYLLGRGLVEPVDDMRATNPPSNGALLDALAERFVKNGFNLKLLLRDIMTSRLYQLSSVPTKGNAADDRFYSHYRVKRLTAESLVDAIDYAAGTRTKFENMPLGARAIQLPDADYKNYSLRTFGKPKRASVCECERVADPNLSQALHTLNGDLVAGKIADPKGRVAGLVDAKKSFEEIVTELYLVTLCRRPTADEMAMSRKFLEQNPEPKAFYEDLLWSLINSKQFLFVH